MREYTIIETELGWVGVMCSAVGVCATTTPRSSPYDAVAELRPARGDRELDEEAFGATAGAIRARAHGDPAMLEVSLDLSSGTPFQQLVWRAVLTIPYGKTRSYGWVAAEIGNPRAAHAVGQAVSQNPLPLLIPCHRVVAADGTLGGFGRGHLALPTKRSLLRREGINYPGPTLEQQAARA